MHRVQSAEEAVERVDMLRSAVLRTLEAFKDMALEDTRRKMYDWTGREVITRRMADVMTAVVDVLPVVKAKETLDVGMMSDNQALIPMVQSSFFPTLHKALVDALNAAVMERVDAAKAVEKAAITASILQTAMNIMNATNNNNDTQDEEDSMIEEEDDVGEPYTSGDDTLDDIRRAQMELAEEEEYKSQTGTVHTQEEYYISSSDEEINIS